MFNKVFRKYVDQKFNLIIVGAQKAGTTTLHYALNQHPDIFMTDPIKEPGFFLPLETMRSYYANKNIHFNSKEEFFQKHLTKGYKGQKYLGESSTFYTTLEWSSKDLAKRIKDYNPSAKLIYIIRSPLQRIISHYRHELKKRKDLKFDEFLNNPEALGISAYEQRIKPFAEMFEDEKILLINFDFLIKHPFEQIVKILQYLNIESNHKIHLQQLNQSEPSDINLNDLENKLLSIKEIHNLMDEYETLKAFCC